MNSSVIAFVPSINSLFITGLLVFFILIIFITNFTQIMKLQYYQKLILFSAIASAFGIHGLIHLGVEKEYNFNPYLYMV